MKRLIIAILCLCLLAAASVVSAQDAKTYKVTYVGNNCLATVPTDENEYKAGEYVSVLFDPVTYMNGLIFYGWDWNNDGVADFGYSYNSFNMPSKDVVMKAICITPYSGPSYPQPHHHPGPWGPAPRPWGPPPPPPGPRPWGGPPGFNPWRPVH